MPNVTAIRNVWRRANSLLRLLAAFILRHCILAENSCHCFSLYFYRLSQMNSEPFRRESILEIKPLKPIFADNLEKKRKLRFFLALPSFISNRSLVMLFYTGRFRVYARNHVSTIDFMVQITGRGVESKPFFLAIRVKYLLLILDA